MTRSRRPTIEQVSRWIADGYGQGEGRNYKPFFHVRDVPSSGRSSMVQGLITGRTHHYLSDIEYHYHVLIEHFQDVTDIREQFALLPWGETLEIARALGNRHPKYPGTKTPIVMTSDLVVSFRRDECPLAVVSVKPAERLKSDRRKFKRTAEKLLIEMTYWQRRNTPWLLRTEKQLPMNRVANLDRFRKSMSAPELDHLMCHFKAFLVAFEKEWEAHMLFGELLPRLSNRLNLTVDNCHDLLGRAVWAHRLDIDLDSCVISEDLPIRRLNATSPQPFMETDTYA